MNVSEIAAILRRHPLAAVAVLVTAIGITYGVENTPVTIVQSATVVFAVGQTPMNAKLPSRQIDPLIATEVMMTQVMLSPEIASQVRAAGGTAQLGIVPENLYSLQYPDYAEPSATLTATSTSTAAVQRTFTVAAGLLARRMAALQTQAMVPPAERIRTVLIGDTGPVAQPGSHVRVLGGIAVITIVALVMIPVFLDRYRDLVRPQRRSGRRRRSRPRPRSPAARRPVTQNGR
jgi:hypothetical protein